MENEDNDLGTTVAPLDPTEREMQARGAKIERKRISDIQARCRAAQLPPDFAERMVRDGVSGDAIATRILDALVERQSLEGDTRNVSSFIHTSGQSGTNEQTFLAAATDALLLRAGIPVANPNPAAKDLLHVRAVDIARTCLSQAGKSADWAGHDSPQRIITRAMATSDFPLLLSNALGKSLRQGYEDEPASHKVWVRTGTAQDFKLQTRALLGSAPDLLAVNEGGEYEFGSFTEDAATFRLAKYGRIIKLTWEALVNDDLNAFIRIPQGLGQAARRVEADAIYALLSANGNMQDGVPLFHATHGNLAGAGAAISDTSLGLARAAMRKQKAVGGGYLNLEPRFLIVGPDKETEAYKYTSASYTPSSPANINLPLNTQLQVVVDPRISGTKWYLAASGSQVDTIELVHLAEEQGPVVDEEEEFIRDTKAWKIRHTFAAAALDYRGLYHNPGA